MGSNGKKVLFFGNDKSIEDAQSVLQELAPDEVFSLFKSPYSTAHDSKAKALDGKDFSCFDACLAIGLPKQARFALEQNLSMIFPVHSKVDFALGDDVNVAVCTFLPIANGYESEFGFGNAGRQLTERFIYAELDIERVIRTSFELAESRNHSLVYASSPTARAFDVVTRKLLADINEDYPSVSTNVVCTDEILTASTLDVVLAEPDVAHVLFSALSQNRNVYGAYLGDTTIGVYFADEINLSLAVKAMLRHSFDRL